MRRSRVPKFVLMGLLVVCLVGGLVFVLRPAMIQRTTLVAYFDNSNGIYVGDDVMILGVAVGSIDAIEPQPERVKVTFHVDRDQPIPEAVNAAIISPTLVTARAIQLTPAYKGGPRIQNGAVIPIERTAVPVEFDDLRVQLQRLTETLQPTEPGGVSTLGALVNTGADNLRGQGANIRNALIELSGALSVLGDHSGDLFGTVKNLNTLVTALQSSTGLMRALNTNLANATSLLADDPNAVRNAVDDLNTAVTDVRSFVADNRETLGITADKLTSISQALHDSLGDIKQTLHVTPTAFGNFVNIYEPANGSLNGALAMNNFSNPVSFLCGAIEAASRLNHEQSAKLCVQYLAPIIKNRQYNFLPVGANPFVGAQARPNEVTFSEDWLRPLTEAGRVRDLHEGPLPQTGPLPGQAVPPTSDGASEAVAPLPAESSAPASATPTDPAAGLPGMMVPPSMGAGQ